MEYYNPYSGAVYYGGNDYRDYIAHYGVKGMKWGKHLFGLLKDFSDRNITGSAHKGLANFYSNKAAGYSSKANQMKRSLINKNGIFTGTRAQNKELNSLSKDASDYNTRAKQHHDAYNRSLFGRANKARHAVGKTIKNIRKTAKKIGQFASSTIAKGRTAIGNAINSIKNKYRTWSAKRDLARHQKNPTYDGSKNTYKYTTTTAKGQKVNVTSSSSGYKKYKQKTGQARVRSDRRGLTR